MSSDILSQDEIDALILRTNTNDIDPAILYRISSLVTPEMVATVKTMLKRYYYALTHCNITEQRLAKNNLRQAAFKVWLYRNGFVNKFDYVKFINKEVKKRGLGWKLCTL
jgi:hypothetical protein